ncbi:MAG TPA: protein rep [Usitatibacter sp.]|nr:protein rep [Usitatibacter sp.]
MSPRERLAARRERFNLASAAARILYRPDLQAPDQHRTVWCHRSVKTESGKAYIRRRDDGSSARLTGVNTCGSVWTCPVCSARVAERRREELERGMVRHVGAGGRVYLMTLTSPHERDLELETFKRLFGKALQRFKNSRAFKRVSQAYGRIGSVRSLEITWGPEHGWHVHTHDLIFAGQGLELDTHACDELRGAWITALVKVGLADSSKLTWMWEHALDLRGGDAAAEYVTKFGHDAKWGITAEVTRSHAKLGMRRVCEHQGHVTPFQVLAWAAEGDGEASHLFREFAAVFKDARMLYWTPGLKGKLRIDEETDEAIAGDDQPMPGEREVAELESDELALVMSRGALGELVEFVSLCEEQHQACVDDFLDVLRDRPRRSRGAVRVKNWKRSDYYVLEASA